MVLYFLTFCSQDVCSSNVESCLFCNPFSWFTSTIFAFSLAPVWLLQLRRSRTFKKRFFFLFHKGIWFEFAKFIIHFFINDTCLSTDHTIIKGFTQMSWLDGGRQIFRQERFGTLPLPLLYMRQEPNYGIIPVARIVATPSWFISAQLLPADGS